ncbi:MAG TPA: SufD family Fe-S cluster assembly protein [Candidatus Binatia bacterium]|nr:SufD family Fe-S cluster assembly protein [Candidatus Binatia bacterium]
MTDTATRAGAVSRAALEARLATSPAWLAGRRTTAWDAFTALPKPSSMRDEDWRRTDIAKLTVEDFQEPLTDDDSLLERARSRHAQALPEAALLLCSADGTTAIENAEPLLAQGVIVASLEEAVLRHPELVQRGLSGIGAGDSYFLALWNALWRGGAFVYVPRGAQAGTPLWISHLAAPAGAAGFPATVVVVDAEGSLTLVEDHVGSDDEAPRLSVSATAIHLSDRSRLDDVPIQQLPPGTWQVSTRRATCAAAARYRLIGASLGSRLQKAYWDVMLEGQASEADIFGVCFAAQQQHLDHQSLQLHRGRDTRSRLLLKVAARDRAQSVYSGLIDVEPDAVHADGYVINRNLLLTHGASASGVPRLEIKANDVRCGHGTTVGHVDDDERFYVMSRGIPAEEAERLIVGGFFADCLDHVAQESLRAWLVAALEAEAVGSLSGAPASAGGGLATGSGAPGVRPGQGAGALPVGAGS